MDRETRSADYWDRRYESAELVWSTEPSRFVAEALAEVEPGRALDLAAGEGRNAIWLAGRGWDVTAVDFSEVALGKARRLAARQGVAVEWICADLAEWSPPAAAFDAVVVAYLQVGASLLRSVLAGATAALAPGGLLVVVGHDRANLTRGWGGPQDPAVLYGVGEITEALGDLEIQRAGAVERAVDTPEGPRVAIDTFVTARVPRRVPPSSGGAG